MTLKELNNIIMKQGGKSSYNMPIMLKDNPKESAKVATYHSLLHARVKDGVIYLDETFETKLF